jgi:NAD(P)-dependent dehydrogenase (short-subunit alcohol dehydrogenase family)
MSKVWLITGASRGIGAGIVRALLAAGEKVVATARKAESVRSSHGTSDNLLSLALDVTKPDQAERAVADAKARFGRIDVLVNNAGYGQLGHFETISPEQIQRQFDTNVFGAMHVTRAVLPVMRAQGAGHVFTISSAIGLVSVPGSTMYAATKHALEGWMEGLAAELKNFGIAATLLEPGFFKTDFLSEQSVAFGDVKLAAYDELEAKNHEHLKRMTQGKGGDSERLGAALITLANMKDPPVRIAAGSGALTVFKMKADRLTAEAAAHADLSRAMDAD